MIKYACEDHIDDAMDDVINENETFPTINIVEGEKCFYCNENCKYEVKI